MKKDFVQLLYERILQVDRKGALAVANEWIDVNGYQSTIEELLEPALLLFGEHWMKSKDVTLAHGYIAGKVSQDILEKVMALKGEGIDVGKKLKGPIVMGNIEDDYHALGRMMVVNFLRSSGWEVHDLGNDTLAAAFVDKAVNVGAEVIGVSAMMYTTAVNIKKLRQEIDERGLADRIKLAVGGAVFILRPELVAEVGGDGTAKNAFTAVKCIDDLWVKVRGRYEQS